MKSNILARWWLVLQAEVKSLCRHKRGSVTGQQTPPLPKQPYPKLRGIWDAKAAGTLGKACHFFLTVICDQRAKPPCFLVLTSSPATCLTSIRFPGSQLLPLPSSELTGSTVRTQGCGESVLQIVKCWRAEAWLTLPPTRRVSVRLVKQENVLRWC